MRKGPSIRTLLFGAHAFVWLVPALMFLFLRIYDTVLLRQTEYQLISESVVLGEAFRAAWLRAQGRDQDQILPPGHDEKFLPFYAQIGLNEPTMPAGPSEFPRARAIDELAARAGAEMEPLMRRAQTFNLSGVRILDAHGAVVATTRGDAACTLAELPEVQRAMAGRFSAVLRERHSDEPPPPFGDIRRRGKVRVFTALPVWSDGRVIGVVRASRTGLDALSSLWANRRGLVWLGSFGALLLAAVSLGFSAIIARPLGKLTRAARGVAQGEKAEQLALTGLAPWEIAELQAVLHGMAQRLERRATYVEEFARQVSHELKTPITAIRGAAELLSHGIDDMPAADRDRFVGNIVEDTRRMERLVTRLLDLARHENAARDEASQPLEVASFARYLLARHGERVQLAAPEALTYPVAEHQLEAVLTNLVDNALRHSKERVLVRLTSEGEKLRVDVTDRGAGVSEANRKRLFERFFTTERARGGTGLGLAIVRAIAESRGGEARATFDERGTTFSVVL